MITVRLRWCRGKEYYSQQDGEELGNKMVELLLINHHILSIYFNGYLECQIKDFSKLDKCRILIKVEDTALAIFEYKNKRLGLIEATNAIRPKNLEGFYQ